MKPLLIVTVILAMQPAKPEDAKRASQGKAAQSAEQSDSAKNGTDNPPPSSVSVTVNNASPSPNPQSKEEEFNENMRVQRRLALYTGLLVLVGSATAFVIGWQSVETHRAAGAAKKSADAAARTGEAFVQSERAFIVIEPCREREGYLPTPQSLKKFTWRIRNVGKTTAILIETQAVYRREDFGKPLADTPDYGLPIELRGRPLAPGDEYTYDTYLTEWSEHHKAYLPVTEAIDLVGGFYLLAFGYVRYRTFGQICWSRFIEDYMQEKGTRGIPMFRPRLGNDVPSAYTEHRCCEDKNPN